MSTPTPTLETVLTAIKTVMVALAPTIGTVREFDRTLDSELEDLELFQAGDFSIHLWTIELEGIDEVEGEASGEHYSIYRIRIRYDSVIKASASSAWSKTARERAELVRDGLNKNAAVFRISGQVQLREPEAVEIRSHGFVDVEDQKVYRTDLALRVEARRWS